MPLMHDKPFMLRIFDELRKELPEFDAYLTRDFENKTMIVKELFHPTDEDNQVSTEILENLLVLVLLLSLRCW